MKSKVVPLFIDRELSWLSFNERVLQEAKDPNVPLIERLRFLGIFSSNLDEFFRVRVAAINRLIHFEKKGKANFIVDSQVSLKNIKKRVMLQQNTFEKLYKEVLLNELAEEDVFLINEKQLNLKNAQFVKSYFKERVLASLVPIMLDKYKSFPFLKDRAIYLYIKLYNQSNPERYKLALIEIPTNTISRFVILPNFKQNKYIILLEDVIRYCLDDIFVLFNVKSYDAHIIKLTRDAELDIDMNDMQHNNLEKLSKSLKLRKKGTPVRLVYDQEIPRDMLSFLKIKLKLHNDNIIPGGRYHNFKDFMKFPDLGKNNLIYPKIIPIKKKEFANNNSMFSEISKRDLLIHTPYHSFDYVIQFLREAAIDPKVHEIKISLYRLAADSKIINTLINASRNGKKVTVVLELKARFDEENNLFWNQKLADEGITVLHGLTNRKVHMKMCLITRKEKNEYVYYSHLSTGNYNELTAGVYSDYSFFTCDGRITSEVAKLFKCLENGNIKGVFKSLLVAPLNLRKNLEGLIQKEIANAKAGLKSGILLKLNNLVDTEIIKLLYEASKVGVPVRIIVRGICCLVPNIKGLSENISVISIIDKFLEHTRVFQFCNDGKVKIYISSADLMFRNLDLRAEIAFPIFDTDIQDQLVQLLEIQWNDNCKARIISNKNENLIRVSKGEIHRAQVDTYTFLSK